MAGPGLKARNAQLMLDIISGRCACCTVFDNNANRRCSLVMLRHHSPLPCLLCLLSLFPSAAWSLRQSMSIISRYQSRTASFVPADISTRRCFTVSPSIEVPDASSVTSGTLSFNGVALRQGEERRRHFVQGLCSTVALASCSFAPFVVASSTANAATTPVEAIRQGASQLPGYGKPDVFYPSVFAGTWKVTRTVFETGNQIVYNVRYLTLEDGRVVADRGYNEASYQVAINQGIQSVDWDVTNPNTLTIAFNNGSQREIKVTKRVYEVGSDEGVSNSLFSSEYRRVTDIDAVRGIPSLSGSRVLTKWKWGADDADTIDGVELIMNDRVLGDPLAAEVNSGEAAASVSKSRLHLERINR